MANTIELIASSTASGSGTSITFSSIPATYTDLCIKYSARSTVAASLTGYNLTMNSTRTTSLIRLLGESGGASSSTNVGNGQGEAGFVPAANATASTFCNNEIYIPNYLSSNQKSYSVDSVTENNASGGYIHGLLAGLTNMTSAITSITISDTSTGNIAANSTFYLYGVKNS
jgi:hypothetical protein